MSTTAIPRPLPFAPPASAGSATASSPPLILPGEHFAAALVFFVAGAVGIAYIAPDLAVGAFYLPRVVAVVHLFTLGWIMLSIFGALCQFLPVAVGRSIKWERLAHVSFGFQAVGVVVFIAALLLNNAHILHLGATLVSTAFVLFAINLIATLVGAERSVTWWALAGASFFLIVTPAYGIVLALNLHGGMLGAERFALVARHVHVAIIGVVLLTMVGVAHRLLPMFLLSHGASERPAWIATALLFAGSFILAVPFGGNVTAGIAGGLIAAGVVAFLLQAIAFFRTSKRRIIDPGMKLAAAGLGGLALALLIAPFALSRGFGDVRLLATYHLVLLGGISLFVAGHYYKIVPFLVWYHRFGPLAGLKKIPLVTELYSMRMASVNASILIAGWLGVVAGTYFGWAPVVRISALVFALGAVIEAVVVAQISQRKPA